MKVSDYIASFLKAQGCAHVFGYQGGAITHLVDSLYQTEGIQFIGTYHEQGAAFAAEGYARASADPHGFGVAIATSGPGATNLMTGIGSAFFDAIPCLYLTGQVNTYEYKGARKVRQLGFQEMDIVSIVAPITKYAVQITDPNLIRYEMEKAIHIALSGRKGPVLIDLPMDIQRAEISEAQLPAFVPETTPKPWADLDTVMEQINKSTRPVFLVGGGVRSAGACEVLAQCAEQLQIPVVTSLMGKDAFDHTSALHFGMLGAYGNRYANLTIANSDCIIALGTRLDTRQTGTNVKTFAREAKLIRVDIDENELEREIKPDEIKINADVRFFLETLQQQTAGKSFQRAPWLDFLITCKQKYPTYEREVLTDPNYLMTLFSKQLCEDAILCFAVGQYQMWGAQSIGIQKNQRFLTSGGMGAMGFSIPCAIGAYYANPTKPVYAFCGDGGAQMNIQELQLIRRNQIPIRIVVLNNHSLGMIRHFQEMYFDSRYYGTVLDYTPPDFCQIAKAYGIPHQRMETQWAFTNVFTHQYPFLLEVHLPQNTYVYPKLAVNRPIEDQEPLLPRADFYEDLLVVPENIPTPQAYKTYVVTTLNKYKQRKGTVPSSFIPICAKEGQICGQLRPVTKSYPQTFPQCESTLAQWRNQYPNRAATTFTSTTESTKKWLDQAIIGKDDRILFLIFPDKCDLPMGIGHIGLKNFDMAARTCEIDPVIRGEQGFPGMMSLALHALIAWAYETLQVDGISLRVLPTNTKAIEFYKKNGFVVEEKQNQEVEYVIMKI